MYGQGMPPNFTRVCPILFLATPLRLEPQVGREDFCWAQYDLFSVRFVSATHSSLPEHECHHLSTLLVGFHQHSGYR